MKPTAQIKDINEKEGIIQGYFASFNTKDAHGDIFSQKAFNRSVSHFKSASNSRIAHLYQHKEPIAKITELAINDKGLFFTSKISKSRLAQDVLIMYEEGILKEHSVGFYNLKEEKSQEGNIILEAQLLEGSTVLWGANENTPLTAIKSLESLNPELIDNFFTLVNRYIKEGKIKEDTQTALLSNSQNIIKSLTRLESTQTGDEILIKEFLNRLEDGRKQDTRNS